MFMFTTVFTTVSHEVTTFGNVCLRRTPYYGLTWLNTDFFTTVDYRLSQYSLLQTFGGHHIFTRRHDEVRLHSLDDGVVREHILW